MNDSADHPLAIEGFNAIIAGNGAIGCALAAELLTRPNLGSLVVLQRGDTRTDADSRLSTVHVDAQNPETFAQASKAISDRFERAHLVINTIGVLHNDVIQPEKRLSDFSPAALAQSITVNSMVLPLLAQSVARHMRHEEPSILASLSARVGSIADNDMGGWYSYRASKAAHNMLLRTLSREWRVSHRNTAVVALHPGTVESRLSAPFISPKYPHTVHQPQQSARALLAVISQLSAEDSGSFFDWQGKHIPW